MYAQAHTRLITFSERVNPVCGNLITDIRPIHNTHSGTHTHPQNTIVRLFRLIASGSLRVLPPPSKPPTPPVLNEYSLFVAIDCGTILFFNKMSTTDAPPPLHHQAPNIATLTTLGKCCNKNNIIPCIGRRQ